MQAIINIIEKYFHLFHKNSINPQKYAFN